MPTYKKSVNIDLLPEATYRRKLNAVRDAGFDFIDLKSCFHSEDRLDTAKILREFQIPVSLVTTIDPDKYSISDSYPGNRANAYELAVRDVWCSAEYGSFCFTIPAGKVIKGITRKQALKNSKNFFASFKGWVEKGKKPYTVLVENPADGFFKSAKEMADYIDSMKSMSFIGVCLNIGHIPADEKPEEWITVLGSRIKSVRVSNYDKNGNTVPLTKGIINYKKVMKALSDIGYDGPISADYAPDERGTKGISEDLDAVIALK